MTMIDGPVDAGELASPSEPVVAPSITPQSDAPLRYWIRRAVALDAVAAAVAVWIAGLLRFGWHGPTNPTTPYVLLAVGVVVGWPLLGALSGTYELRPSLFGVEELRRILRAGLVLVAGLGMTHFTFKLSLSRGFVAILIPLVVAFSALGRMVLRARTSNWMAHGRSHHRAVALGTADEVAYLRAQMRQPKRGGSPIEIVAYVADDLDDDDQAPPILDGLRRLPDREAVNAMVAEGGKVDLLVRAGRPDQMEMAVMTQRAQDIGAWVAISPHRSDTAANVAFSYVPLGSTPLLLVESPNLRPAAAFLKSTLDRIMAVGFLIVLSPVMLAIAVAIAVVDGRPVLFSQDRVGRGGELFRCIKFRTMCRGAEDQLPGLLDSNEHEGPLFKIRNDPRVTRTGRWLRHHSLDELPQLWNVLRGDMSIVGPRPSLPSEVETFDVRTRRRLLVRPGITGLWQVQGRSDLEWDEGVYLDVMYVDHWSPLLDWVIIARTLRTVINPTGAY